MKRTKRMRLLMATLVITILLVPLLGYAEPSANNLKRDIYDVEGKYSDSRDFLCRVETRDDLERHSEATLEDEFEGNSIIVVLTIEASRRRGEFTTCIFTEVDLLYVRELDYLSGYELGYAEEIWAMEEYIVELVKQTDEMRNIRGISSEEVELLEEKIYETIEEFYTLLAEAEDNTLVRFEDYRKILFLRLLEECKEDVLSAIALLQQREDVYYAGVNEIISLEEGAFKVAENNGYMGIAPSLAGDQWAMNRINVSGAWNITRGTSAVRVGIIDSGIEASHPEFGGRVLGAPLSRDFTGQNAALIDPRPPSGTSIHTGHGTMTASIVGARRTLSGVAPGVDLVSLRVFGWGWNVGVNQYRLSTPNSRIIEAINHGRVNGIPILNYSGGYTANAAFETALRNYTGIFVTSAGNQGNNLDNVVTYADLPNVIVVGASDQNDNRVNIPGAWASNYSSRNVNIFAPGSNMRVATVGHSTAGIYSGTSAAAPHVAGTVALIRTIRPTLRFDHVRYLVLNTGDRPGGLVRYSSSGTRLNAANAVTAASRVNQNAIGHLDILSVLGSGRIRVAGWGFDYDNVNRSVEIHVWIGGPAGHPNATGYNIGVANQLRVDVPRAHPFTTNHHGFDITFATNRRGNLPVYVYVINLSGTPGSHMRLPRREVTIN